VLAGCGGLGRAGVGGGQGFSENVSQHFGQTDEVGGTSSGRTCRPPSRGRAGT
jgi:hypothetical protein